MIQFLNRAKNRKGFTMIELIVVIGVLAVLSAIILPMFSARDSKIQEANSTARDYYAAVQTVMTKMSMYEGPLTPAYQANPNLGEMRYYENMGGNYPYMKGSSATAFPNTTSLYIELAVKNNIVTEVYTNALEDKGGTDTSYADGKGLYELCKREASMKDTEFGKAFKAEIENRIHYRDGFYYAKVTYKNILSSTIPQKMEAETVKVEYTGYSNRRLPQAGSLEFNSYKNANLYFGEDNVLVNDSVFGVCAPVNTSTGAIMGFAGTSLN